MTEKEQKYLDNCNSLLAKIVTMEGDPGAKAVCVNALSHHIREWLGIWTEPALHSPDKQAFMIGLTFADIIQLENGGIICVNPKDVGLLDMPTTIFLGGTEEHMAKGMAKHPGTAHKYLDSHGDAKN